MTITLSNLRYAEPSNTLIDMEVTGWLDDSETIPFTYHPDDQADLSLWVSEELRVNGANYTITPYVAPTPVQPTVVSPRQIRLALNQEGLRTDVENYVASASQDVKDSWDYATEFVITDPLIVGCMQALGKTQDDLNALFQLAATL